MPPKEKEEVPEVWTKREFTTGEGDAKETFSMKIREPQEMSDVMTKFVCETTEASFKAHPDFDKEGSVIATEIRKALEEKFEPCWQVVLGRNFGSHVTYQSNNFINFYRGQVNVLVMKTV